MLIAPSKRPSSSSTIFYFEVGSLRAEDNDETKVKLFWNERHLAAKNVTPFCSKTKAS